MKKFIIFMVIFIFVAFLNVSATIIDVPDDYPTIQAGIDASSDGDTVLVDEGIYVENINFNGHNIVLGSLFLTTGDTSYISSTIIDGDSSGSVVRFESGEDSTAVIRGFTIENGYNITGGGIHCYNSDPIISYNNISSNSVATSGGGIYCEHFSSPTISNNIISGNSTDGWEGGGIGCLCSSPMITNNIIIGNSASLGGGICCFGYSDATIINNTIIENSSHYWGGGIGCFSSNLTIRNNTIMENVCDYIWSKGGGICCRSSSNLNVFGNIISGNSAGMGGGISCKEYSHANIINNTIIENTAACYGGGIFFENSSVVVLNSILWADTASIEGNEIYSDSSSSIVIIYCDVKDTLLQGEGNISVDPLFRDPDNSVFHLMAIECGDPYDSPCIDAGHPDILDSLLDCDWGLGELRSDMGAYGGGASQVGIVEQEPQVPNQFTLLQNYPNPFNASTIIRYSLPVKSDVQLDIYNILGQRVTTLFEGIQQAGEHRITWNATNLPSGVYFARLNSIEYSETIKMVLLK